MFKLKSVQELAAIRFDLNAARGRELLSARLHLRGRNELAPRWLRVSTVSARWTEGSETHAYSGRDGASWNSPDIPSHAAWAWPGSSFCDVSMGAGRTEVHTLAVHKDQDRWLSVDLPLTLVSAMICGVSDGLALMEGGSPYNRNYYFQSVQSWAGKPWLEVECGPLVSGPAPSAPRVSLSADPSRATLEGGAERVAIAPDSTVFAWRGWLDDEPLANWRIPRPTRGDSTVFTLDGLDPRREHTLALQAVSREGYPSRQAQWEMGSSSALALPQPLELPSRPPAESGRSNPPAVWGQPALAKLDPSATLRLDRPGEDALRPWVANAVWDGRKVWLAGARREALSFQLVVQNGKSQNLSEVSIQPRDLVSVNGDTLQSSLFRLSSLWYVERADAKWQPSYLLPLRSEEAVPWRLPEGGPRRLSNRSFFVELTLPPDSAPGIYRGALVVTRTPGGTELLPLQIEVVNWSLPLEPGFRIELNAYRVPPDALDYFRLARDNRCVFTPWVLSPRLKEEGPAPSIDWSQYDALADSLLDGSAFPQDPRPLEVLYLPFWESWPTVITPANYHYQGRWPTRGDPFRWMWDHPETAPPVDQAFAPSYSNNFVEVERAFVKHFASKGWKDTELHCFFGSKMRHRTDWGRSTWWNTDEPLYWTDWSALSFFLSLFDEGLDPDQRAQWMTRADISRPEWLEGALDSRARIVYTGGQTTAAQVRRCRELARELHFRWQIYGAANQEDQAVSGTAAWVLGAWLDGARGALVWLSLGDENSWTEYDPDEFPGTALVLAPSSRSDGRVVADLRLKALRDAQQLSEWLTLLQKREGLEREQMVSLLQPFFSVNQPSWWHLRSEETPAVHYGNLDTASLEALRDAIIRRLF